MAGETNLPVSRHLEGTFLRTRNQVIGVLGLIFGLGAAALALTRPHDLAANSLALGLLGSYFLVNLSTFFDRFLHRRFQRLSSWLFLFNCGVLTWFLSLLGHSSTDWYLALGLIVVMAALGQTLRLILVATAVVAAVYAFYESRQGSASLLETVFLLRLTFLFLTAIFVGYLCEATRRDLEETRKESLAAIRQLNDELQFLVLKLAGAHHDLAEAKKQRDNVLNSMEDLLVVTDRAGNVHSLNRAASTRLGFERTDLIGKPLNRILGPQDQVLARGLRQLVAEGTLRGYPAAFVTKWGEALPVGLTGSLLRDREGNVFGEVFLAREMPSVPSA